MGVAIFVFVGVAVFVFVGVAVFVFVRVAVFRFVGVAAFVFLEVALFVFMDGNLYTFNLSGYADSELGNSKFQWEGHLSLLTMSGSHLGTIQFLYCIDFYNTQFWLGSELCKTKFPNKKKLKNNIFFFKF